MDHLKPFVELLCSCQVIKPVFNVVWVIRGKVYDLLVHTMNFNAVLVSWDEIPSETGVDTQNVSEVNNLHIEFASCPYQVHVFPDKSLIVIYLFKLEYMSTAWSDHKVPTLLLLLKRPLSHDVTFDCWNQFYFGCLKVLNESLCLVKHTACLTL